MRNEHIFMYVLIIAIISMLAVTSCKKGGNSSDAGQNIQSERSTELNKKSTFDGLKASERSLMKQNKNQTIIIVAYLLVLSIGHLIIVKVLLEQLVKNSLSGISSRVEKIKSKIDELDERTRRFISILEKHSSDSANANGQLTTNQFDLKPVEDWFRKIEHTIDAQFRTMNNALQRDKTEEQNIQSINCRLDGLNSSLEIQMSEIISEIQDMKSKLDPLSDDRFMPLRVNFPENFPLISQAYYTMNKSNDSQAHALRSFIRDYAKIIGLHAISQNPEQLELTYSALREILKDRPLELILPRHGSVFDPDKMNQDKVYGENATVFRIVYPGFIIEDTIEKALVDVR
jgi:outer membrane murein-binding lipoprotein Lpp